MCDLPPEPVCQPGRKPHPQRVREIHDILPEGKSGGICIDDTPEHRAWYLHELTKYPRLIIESQGPIGGGIYVIRVRKGPSLN
jgi:hypothetical protein